jgi:hypothetical protein
MNRYAIIQDGKVEGCINWDGEGTPPDGVLGPLPTGWDSLDMIKGRSLAEIEAIVLRGQCVGMALEPEVNTGFSVGKRFAADPEPEVADFISTPQGLIHPDVHAAELLSSKDMPWFAFKAQAKRILRDAMPEKKADIIKALEALAD